MVFAIFEAIFNDILQILNEFFLNFNTLENNLYDKYCLLILEKFSDSGLGLHFHTKFVEVSIFFLKF